MKITKKEIRRVRNITKKNANSGKQEPHKKPSWLYRVAMATTKPPYNFKKQKARRKMAKVSRRRNR